MKLKYCIKTHTNQENKMKNYTHTHIHTQKIDIKLLTNKISKVYKLVGVGYTKKKLYKL